MAIVFFQDAIHFETCLISCSTWVINCVNRHSLTLLLCCLGAIGSFHWPIGEYRPEEVLGNSYEALDPIRMDLKCYLVFVKDKSMFQVMGQAKKVQQGLLRLRKTCFQIAARQISPVRLYLLHWSEATDLPSHVSLQPYRYPSLISEEPVVDIKQGNAPRGEGTADDMYSRLETQTMESEETAGKSLLQTLKKLHYYRGNIQMRIRLGTFLATQYKKPKDGNYELDEYESMIKESQFFGQVTQECVRPFFTLLQIADLI